MSRPELVGNVIQQTLDKMGLLTKAKRFLVFWSWAEMVGEIARNARPRRIDGDVLYVATASSAWAQELTLMRKSIIQRINAYLGGNYIKDIRFSEHLWGTTQDLGDGDICGKTHEEYKRFMSGDVLTPGEKERIDSLADTAGGSPLCSVFRSFVATMEKRQKYLLKKGLTRCNSCGCLYGPGRRCPYCKAKQELNDYHRVLAILERHPETSDLTLAVITGIREKETFAKARQTLDSRWHRELRHGYFAASTGKPAGRELARFREVAVKLASLRTGQPGHRLTAEDLEKVIGKRFASLARARPGRRRQASPEPNIDSV
ncbi:MAG: DUF721 domain-containing protein [Firmicutes bacterium]|nr:DUF721 domain-containing protein [Candidatus Fermentithermobacillaceae bacterium]